MSTDDSVQKIKAIFEQFEATGLSLLSDQREAIGREILESIGSDRFSFICDNLLPAMVAMAHLRQMKKNEKPAE